MLNNKKLVYTLTTSYASLKSKEHFVFFEDKALSDGGYRIKTITPHQKGQPSKENIESIEIHRFRYLPENYEISSSLPDALKSISGKFKLVMLSTFFLFTTFFQCIREKPDLILAHWAVPSGIIAYLMMKIFKIKYVVSIHGGDVAPLKNFSILRKFVIKILNKSSIVIVNGEFTENEFIKMGVSENKLRIIYGPPNYTKHSSDLKFLSEYRNKITHDKNKIILTVTRLTEIKGTEYLIRAISKLNQENVHCVIVGTGELLSELNKVSNSLDIADKITFFGRANHQELGWLYDISDVFVLPSIIDSTGAADAMPLVIPEAMESKLPVIGTNIGGIPFMIEHEKNGLLVKEKDSDELADAINRILSNSSFAQSLVDNSQILVKKRTLKITHDKYIEAINQAISEN